MSNVRSFADRCRRPSGVPSNPLILLEGGELTGKTYSALLLTASDRVGRSWMLQLGETDGDPYGAIVDDQGRPVRYELVEHDGTWHDIMAAAEGIHAAGTAAREAGELPPVWIFDSATIEWEMLSTWAHNRAMDSDSNKALLAKDPNAEVRIGHMYWTSANRRHARLMTLLRTFPGIVVVTARGRWVTKFDAKGQPTRDREYTLEAHKQLGFHSKGWVRLSQDHPPTIINVRLAQGGIVPGLDRPLVVDGRRDERFRGVKFSVEWLVFDFMGYDHTRAAAVGLNEPVIDAAPDLEDLAEAAGVSPRCMELEQLILKAENPTQLREIWDITKNAIGTEEITVAEGNRLRNRFEVRGGEMNGGRRGRAA